MGISSKKFELIHGIVNTPGNVLTVKELCSIAGASRSGYYNWIKAADKREERERKDRQDFELVLEAYRHRGYDKGAKGIHMRLLHVGIVMNVKKIRRLMKKYNLHCPIRKANPYKQLARDMKTSHIADNLLQRQFMEHGPRAVLLTDITYIPLNGKFVYLSTILDAGTKQILAYELSQSLEVDFVLETIKKLIRDHGISLDSRTLIHSDQGCHYTSTRFIELINSFELRQSMSRRGNCWDNAPQESFFGHMKQEVSFKGINTFEEIKTVIDDWMDYYNNDRYQWKLSKLSPNEYYNYITTGIYPLPCAA